MPEIVHRNSLKPGHRIQWYEIERILGQGGFGITYLALDSNLNQHVAIKEYLPIELAVREGDFSVHPLSGQHGSKYEWGLDRFVKEAQTLANFKHPNIVRVLTVFELNNTAYIAMEYEQGQTFQDLLTKRHTLGESELLGLLIPILGGLDKVHQSSFIHRDIKPANIFIRDDGSPVLLDFGSARQALGEETKTLTSLVSPGYAPFEQYYSKSDDQGPWTDIYGLGATLYRAVTGIAPMDAVDRSKSIIEVARDTLVSAQELGHGRYSERFLEAIDHAIEFKPEDRPQNIADWLEEFGPADRLQTIVAERAREVSAQRAPTAHEKRPTFRVITIGLLALLVGTVLILNFHRDLTDSISRSLEDEFGRDYDPNTGALDPQRIAELKAEFELETAQAQAQQQEKQQIEELLRQAEADLRDKRLVDPASQNALMRYNAILKLDPANQDAVDGKKRIFQTLMASAEQAINRQAYVEAEANLLRAEVVLPGSVELRLSRVRLTERKAEAERIATEAENQRRAEANRIKEEQQKLAELERRRFEEDRLRAEEQRRLKLERERQAEVEKKARYARLMDDGQLAIEKQDKELAHVKYEEALEVYPNDPAAMRGLTQAEALMDRSCLEIIGTWTVDWALSRGIKFTFERDGTITWHRIPHYENHWECVDPHKRRFRVSLKSKIEWTKPPKTWDITLSADGQNFDGTADSGYGVKGVKNGR